MSNKFKIYFGASLFSEMELEYNKNLVEKIRQHPYLKDKVEVYLPQENEAINDKSSFADSKMIALGDTNELLESHLLIALLDGQVMDVGLASEIGVAFAKGKYILGLFSDSRQGTYGNQQKIDALDQVAESQFPYVNLYTVGLVKSNGQIVKSSTELLEALVKQVEKFSI